MLSAEWNILREQRLLFSTRSIYCRQEKNLSSFVSSYNNVTNIWRGRERKEGMCRVAVTLWWVTGKFECGTHEQEIKTPTFRYVTASPQFESRTADINASLAATLLLRFVELLSFTRGACFCEAESTLCGPQEWGGFKKRGRVAILKDSSWWSDIAGTQGLDENITTIPFTCPHKLNWKYVTHFTAPGNVVKPSKWRKNTTAALNKYLKKMKIL